MEYIRRITDLEIDRRIEAFHTLCIVGPKGCGKTRTASERSKTVIAFQDEEHRGSYLAIAQTQPTLFFRNPKPILFDEWQDAPKIWEAIRKECDAHPEATGAFFLTCSTSRQSETPHTGAGQISQLTMYPMTLYETGESNGEISLFRLITDRDFTPDGCMTDLKLEELLFSACRGGWPRCLALKSDAAKLEVARNTYRQICEKDISTLDGVNRNPEWARLLLCSYARNMATCAKKTGIFADVKAHNSVSDPTLISYVAALEQLFVIRDIAPWTPQLRSITSIRSSKKHIFVDPSIGLAALGIQPEYFYNDLALFEQVFENMVLRDLLVYAQAHGANVLHYTDDARTKADAVYQLADGRYALIEIRVGMNSVPDAEKSLLKLQSLIRKYNEEAQKDPVHPRDTYREPDALLIICANAHMAYTTENGVRVIPIGCLKD